jgi:hypothetical protein
LGQLGTDGGSEFRLPYAVAGSGDLLVVADLRRPGLLAYGLETR